MDTNNIDNLVSMLDDMVVNGHGHITVSYDPDQEGDSVETLGCIDCAKGNLACSVPTLHEGIDEAFDELP
ncbi:MAG: hypothetical protein ACI4EK_08250 [Wujia sp.]